MGRLIYAAIKLHKQFIVPELAQFCDICFLAVMMKCLHADYDLGYFRAIYYYFPAPPQTQKRKKVPFLLPDGAFQYVVQCVLLYLFLDIKSFILTARN